ncbi:hypothetical protein [Aquisphaera giovannonii]|nr:hypothetical protein [Aquisphaera giovannonii]
MTRRREHFLIKSCWRMARNARKAGVPFGAVWAHISQVVERTMQRMRTEQERETFVAIMQRLRDELGRECGVATMRKAG